MRTIIKLLAGCVLVLAAAWIGLWWYAQGRMQAGLTGWITQVQTDGNVQFSYDSIARGSSPLAATVTLINPRWTQTLSSSAGQVTLASASVTLRILPLNPLVMHIDTSPQWQISTPQTDVTINFGSLDQADEINPQALFDAKIWPPVRGYSLDASDISILASSGSLEVMHIGSLTGQGLIDMAASSHDTAYHSQFEIQGLALSPLLVKFGNIPFGGKIDDLTFTASLSGPVPADLQQRVIAFQAAAAEADRTKIAIQSLHDWAASGGNGSAALGLSLGPSMFNAQANMGFDANSQPRGTAYVTATHMDAFTAALAAAYPQLAGGLNQVQARLSPYLSTSASAGQSLALHVVFAKSGVMVNGTKQADMPPLDWEALENPAAPAPAPPPPAPGDGSGAAVQK